VGQHNAEHAGVHPALNWISGYCTNVHAGPTLELAQQNLLQYALPVQQTLTPQQALPVGLWLAEPAAKALNLPGKSEQFRDWLAEHHLLPFTINGFPQGDFHQPVVKHRVYLPTWADDSRRDYTLLLIEHLHTLLPERAMGSISTLPLGWGTPRWDEAANQKAAENLSAVALRLERLEQETGRRIVIAIEPEPGCCLDTSKDVCDFFDKYLSQPAAAQRNRRYLTVCHDVCHAAVMFETQKQFFDRLQSHDIAIGKVQVSAALEARWSNLDLAQRRAALEHLGQFAEDRYLHQTGVKTKGDFKLWEDLPQLLASLRGSQSAITDQTLTELANQHWRVHFHVPICQATIGELQSTQAEILECLKWLGSSQYRSLFVTGHLEVETYAWTVIPPHLRQASLAESITEEIRWLRQNIPLSLP